MSNKVKLKIPKYGKIHAKIEFFRRSNKFGLFFFTEHFKDDLFLNHKPIMFDKCYIYNSGRWITEGPKYQIADYRYNHCTSFRYMTAEEAAPLAAKIEPIIDKFFHTRQEWVRNYVQKVLDRRLLRMKEKYCKELANLEAAIANVPNIHA